MAVSALPGPDVIVPAEVDQIRGANVFHSFAANLNETPVLTAALPTAFGFIDPHPAPIRINGSQLNVLDGSALLIVGGDIYIQGDTTRFSIAPNMTTQSGPMTIVSVASPGEVVTDMADAVLYTG